MTIWKFQLDITDQLNIVMPVGAKILSLQTQNGIPCMWAIVDEKAEKVRRKLRVFGTGHPIDPKIVDRLNFLGTIQLSDGALIFHVFEEIRL